MSQMTKQQMQCGTSHRLILWKARIKKGFINLKLVPLSDEPLTYDLSYTIKCQLDTGSTVNVIRYGDLHGDLHCRLASHA
jgi:hypothetical protein